MTLLGPLTPMGLIEPRETVARLALTLQAQSYFLAAPARAESVEERTVYMGLPVIRR